MTFHRWRHCLWTTCTSVVILAVVDCIGAQLSQTKTFPINVSTSTVTLPPPTTLFLPSVADRGFSSDLEDTYNGHSADMPTYPIKKYHPKYSDPTVVKKYKPKNKVEEASEKVINVVEENYEISFRKIPTSTGSTPVDSVTASNKDLNNRTDDVLADEGAANATEGYNETDATTIPSLQLEEDVGVAAATSLDREVVASGGNFGAGPIAGIALSIVVVAGLIVGILLLIYRRRYLNKPQVLNDKSSTLDSSGYIDETSLRENSEELYSLDNDSFLNSLEAMTIQNYWTENVKHTKL